VTAEQAFATLHRRLLELVSGSVPVSHATADDACSFAFEQYLRRRPHGQVYEEASAEWGAWLWLLRTAMRHAWRLHRREQCTELAGVRLQLNSSARRLTSAATPANRDVLISLLQDFRALRSRERRALSLVAAGASYGDIVARTGWSMRTVDRRLRRARTKLAATR
jgi:DNA-directed RNA polymerase specialized sigma24 family protein